MRLCHLLNYKPLGTRAIDHFILEYDRQAKARGWQPCFGFTADPPPEMAASLDWFEYRLPWKEENSTIIGQRKPDCVVTSFHSAFEKPILNLKRSGLCKRLIVIDHSSGDGPAPGGWKSILRKLRGRRVGKIVDAIVAVSEFIARRDIERVFLPKDKVHVVHNGIDLTRFPFCDAKPLPILYAGQLIEAKGVSTLIESLKLLESQGLTPETAIAGAGPMLESLKAAAPKHVSFAGHVAEIAAEYRRASIVVIPSLWGEAFGLVAVEAMASGAAVIASDAGALPEVIGDAGVVFRRGDATELAAKLEVLLTNAAKRQSLQQAGRRRVEERFQLADCVSKHLDIAGR